MYVRSFVRFAPHAMVALACSLSLPACDCAGNTNMTGDDAGDTGPRGDGSMVDVGPHDGGPDTGVHPDTGVGDTGPHPDSGLCNNPESCNGMDDDCDGLVDENIAVACGSDIGICRTGTQSCVNGTLGACSGGMMALASDTCGNGLDDNCDGQVDEGCTCTNGATQNCGSGTGECRRGTQTCAGGAWGSCVGEVTPTAEICDGLDNNCDGMSDETFPGLGTSCDGADADQCAEGTLGCSADHMSAVCSDATGDSTELCNGGMDDDCDGQVDEGCTCTNGATQACGTNVGACVAGMQTCANGSWGACVGSTGPSTEICNMVDDNCDGMTDEGFVTGVMCDGPDSDMCLEGMTMCDVTTGGVICGDMTADNLEVCNMMDDNCDGTADEGFNLGAACDGPDADMCNEGVIACNAAGGSSCNDMTGDTVEICDGMDNDCDGAIDEGNPGGGVVCAGAADHGTCVSRTTCVGGALVCRGTFVASAGTAAAPGSDVMPTNSITTAIANAVAIGGGVDVCVCDPAGGATSTFSENVTMVEGVSVLGGFDCASWTLNGNSTTAVQDVDDDGLTFPAAITIVTALDHMTVLGTASPTAAALTAAVTVTDSSPTLSTDTVRAGNGSNAMGLRIVQTGATAASPTVTSGSYFAVGSAGGTATAVRIEGASPHFMTVNVNAGGASGAPTAVATTSYGVDCQGCAGTTFTGGIVSGGGATTTGYGFSIMGAANNISLSAMNVNGGSTSANGSTSIGVRLESCNGAPSFTTVNANGGGNIGSGSPPVIPTGTTRTGLFTNGAMCAPSVTGGRYTGCEAGVTCYGIDATGASPISVSDVQAAPGGQPIGIQGTTGAVDVAIGLRCQAGACSRIVRNQIAAGNLTRAGSLGAGVWISAASPTLDANRITGPNAGSAAGAAPQQYYGVYVAGSASTFSNNVIHDGTHALRVVDFLYDMTPNGIAARSPLVVNNTLDYTVCNTCGPRVGIALFSNAPSQPSGTFRNNIVHNLGVIGTTTPVIEANANADPLFFQNNALWDLTASMGGLYVDESTMPLGTAAAINALNGMPAMSTYGANQVVDCLVNATWHIPMGSACVDTGTNTTCPAADFEWLPLMPTARPFNATCDIGADEFHP